MVLWLERVRWRFCLSAITTELCSHQLLLHFTIHLSLQTRFTKIRFLPFSLTIPFGLSHLFLLSRSFFLHSKHFFSFITFLLYSKHLLSQYIIVFYTFPWCRNKVFILMCMFPTFSFCSNSAAWNVKLMFVGRLCVKFLTFGLCWWSGKGELDWISCL